MTALLILTLVWTAVLVLALLYFLVPTALHLSRARARIGYVADDLEKAADLCEPVNARLAAVQTGAGAVIARLERVRDALARVLSGLRTPVS